MVTFSESPPGPPEASITTWTRLEPRPRGDDVLPSLEARVHDPAWLLGRQWQIGEYFGEDTGEPVTASIRLESAPIVSYAPGNNPAAPSVPVAGAGPLDALAGAEPGVPTTLGWAATAGAELLALLRQHGAGAGGIAAVRRLHPLPAPTPGSADAAGLDLLALLAGRLPDGDALLTPLRAIKAGADVAVVLPGVPAADHDAVRQAAADWLNWYTGQAGPPGDAWVPERLEHQFALRVQPPAVAAYALRAPEWHGDRLDWFDLDVDRVGAPPAPPDRSPPPLRRTVAGEVAASGMPGPLTFPGMPHSRWFEIESSRVRFVEPATGPEDLARALVTEFACAYSNDLYLWPLVLPVGAVHTVTSLTITNTFGDVIDVGPAGDADWLLFRPTEHTGPAASPVRPGLPLLPALAGPQVTEPFERVTFLADEQANLVWAVEETVLGADGRPLDRHTAAATAPGGLLGRPDRPLAVPGMEADDTGPLGYRFETDVPLHWFPMIPDPDGAPQYDLLLVSRARPDGSEYASPPLGELLRPPPWWLWQEEVPREGVRAWRQHVLARDGAGRLLVWRARRKEPGRGQGSSGLCYDETFPI